MFVSPFLSLHLQCHFLQQTLRLDVFYDDMEQNEEEGVRSGQLEEEPDVECLGQSVGKTRR